MNKQRVDQLINDMVKVVITEVDNAINKSNLIFKHKTDSKLGNLIAKSIGKYGLEWDSYIIRDEVTATLYESMLIVAKDKDIEEIKLDNPAYAGPVFKLVDLMLKDRLIPLSKKNREGEVIGTTELLLSPVAEDGETSSSLESILNGSIEMYGSTEESSIFLKWFNANKNNILTKKQLQFVNDELIDMDRHSICKIKKRISDRVIEAWEKDCNNKSLIEFELIKQQEAIEEILEAKDFRAALSPYLEELYIIDTIIDNVSSEAAKAFNTGSNEVWVIKEYRIALFKRLGKIIDQKEGK